MIIADSSAWIAYFRRNHNKVADKLNKLIELEADVRLCGVVQMEVLRGVREDSQHRKISRLFNTFDYLETDKEIYFTAADIYRTCRAKGFTIRSTIDCIIAATALRHDAEVLHDDQDYEVIARFFPLKVF